VDAGGVREHDRRPVEAEPPERLADARLRSLDPPDARCVPRRLAGCVPVEVEQDVGGSEDRQPALEVRRVEVWPAAAVIGGEAGPRDEGRLVGDPEPLAIDVADPLDELRLERRGDHDMDGIRERAQLAASADAASRSRRTVGVIGISQARTPVASWIALRMAGVDGTVAISEIPFAPYGPSGKGSSTISTRTLVAVRLVGTPSRR
jgi:hypothetical protein